MSKTKKRNNRASLGWTLLTVSPGNLRYLTYHKTLRKGDTVRHFLVHKLYSAFHMWTSKSTGSSAGTSVKLCEEARKGQVTCHRDKCATAHMVGDSSDNTSKIMNSELPVATEERNLEVSTDYSVKISSDLVKPKMPVIKTKHLLQQNLRKPSLEFSV